MTVRLINTNILGALGVLQTAGACLSSELPAERPQFSASVRQLAAGTQFTCAVTVEGDVFCWGASQLGTLLPTFEDYRRAQRVVGLRNIIQVSICGGAACALDNGGHVWCWGDNSRGTLAGAGGKRWVDRPQLVPGVETVTSIGLSPAEDIYARTADGMVYVWGGSTWPPRRVTVPGATEDVHSSHGGVCMRLTQGGVACQSLRAPDGTVTSVGSPYQFVTVGGTEDMLLLQTGSSFWCGLKRDATLWCWGANNVAQTGFPPEMSQNCSRVSVLDRTVTEHFFCLREARRVMPLHDVAEMALGVLTGCARVRDGTVWCWGGAFRDLSEHGPHFVTHGDGRMDGERCVSLLYEPSHWTPPPVPCRRHPTQIVGLSRATAIVVGRDHACAALAEGGVRCWGANDFGQLGDGTTTHRATPVPVRM